MVFEPQYNNYPFKLHTINAVTIEKTSSKRGPLEWEEDVD